MISNLNLFRILGTVTLLIAFSFASQAKELPGKKRTPPKPSVASMEKMVDCEPPVSYTEFSLNNVRYGLEAGGQLWENNGDASYEIPKVDPASGATSIHSLYAGALWIGGYSPDGQLKLAAVTFRQGGGTDFYNGPLSNNGFASADYCNQAGYNYFDNHFKANRTDVAIHRSYHQSLIDGTTDELFPDGYTTPPYFNDWPGSDWPGRGNDPNFSNYLAPFQDWDGNGFYEPDQGDYPWYDLDNSIDCRTRAVTDPIPLFGDETLWWVFNDNGGIHTETGGQQIGMEIQAQAFAYTTTDEINNMTFYNYVLINRGVQTLQQCYFGQWVDPDLGCPTDDYVGCDIQRGLSYTYNGTDNDGACDGVPGYDANPPAVGVDFFEGPFQDHDGINNPLTTDLQLVNDQNGIPYAGIGIGYEDLSLAADDPKRDQVIDNERFGMRRFVYYNRGDQPGTVPGVNDEPAIAIEYYSFLNGVWKNGEAMTYGGNAVGGSVVTDYMFPGLTDPVGFATNGQVTNDNWTEEGEANPAGDRRFVQSAGTFQLDPGEFNNITVGVVWARPFADTQTTLNALRIADDKAQSLFDNCFRILSGPDAPDMEAQELNRQIILYLENNNPTSNNYLEGYGFPSDFAFDPLIPDLTSEGLVIPDEDHYYEFQGYKIFQLKNGTVSSAELGDVNRARLVGQSDRQDDISTLINYVDDPELGQKVAVLGVNGSNEGLQHSFVITEDEFATGGKELINFKKYYFMAVAYAHNGYELYNAFTGNGQAITYLESRKSANGGIPVITAIPHDPTLENGGTALNSTYGDIIPVTRLEGEGNGGNVIDLTEESTLKILNSPYNTVKSIEYQAGSSPVNIKVVDPLRVKAGEFTLGFYPMGDGVVVDDVVSDWELTDPDLIGWFLVDNNNTNDTIFSLESIDIGGEQLILDRGFSVEVEQYNYDLNAEGNRIPKLLESTLTFDDPSIDWLSGVPDGDQSNEQNWIRAGTNIEGEGTIDDPSTDYYYRDNPGVDPSEIYESVLGGIVSPWHLGAPSWSGPTWSEELYQGTSSTRIEDLNNVDIKFTSDKAFWTRSAVIELQQFPTLSAGGAEKLHGRIALSLDKNGVNQKNGGNYEECTMNGTQVMNQAALDELSNAQIEQYILAAWPGEDPDSHDENELMGLSFGMGWFPGYAIDVESGERLNIAFGENSALAAENGADMLWNPTSTIWNPFNTNTFDPNNARFGGMHYVYVFRNQMREQFSNPAIRMPHYDNSDFIYKNINLGSERKRIFRACTWIMLPLLNSDFEFMSVEDGLIPSDALMRLRIAKPYERLATVENFYADYRLSDDGFPYFFWGDDSGLLEADEYNPSELLAPTLEDPAIVNAINSWMPYYNFNMDSYQANTNVNEVLVTALDENAIKVVPNPYYGMAQGSGYESNRLDTRVKITNLPANKRAIIRIYDAGGILVRTLDKDSPDTFIDWDLKNERNVPIAGGVHIFHIEIPGVGEKVVKWFGVMRPIDLDNF